MTLKVSEFWELWIEEDIPIIGPPLYRRFWMHRFDYPVARDRAELDYFKGCLEMDLRGNQTTLAYVNRAHHYRPLSPKELAFRHKRVEEAAQKFLKLLKK